MQTSLIITPADHRNFLSPEQKGCMIAWRKGQKPAWPKIDAHKAVQDQLSKWVGEPDTFITPNEFNGWRLVKLLRSINALYADIDMHDSDEEVDMMRMSADAIDRLERAHFPLPNAIVFTGRGLHLYWTLKQSLPAAALPRWQACQRRLVEILKADPQSADATRVLRMVGTENTKASNFRVTAEIVVPERYDFDELADWILPLTRAEIHDLRAARARSNAKRDPSEAKRPKWQYGSIFKRWHLVYEDIYRIAEWHWFGGVPEGHRNAVLFHLANALSWFTKSEALTTEINSVARQHTPSLSNREVEGFTTSIVTRARDAAEKKYRKYGENLVDPRYRFKRSTLWEQFAPLVTDDELLAQLRAIIPDELAEQRKSERDAARWSDSNTGQGVRQGNAQKRSDALRMRSQGLPMSHIAQALGVDPKTIRRWTRKKPK